MTASCHPFLFLGLRDIGINSLTLSHLGNVTLISNLRVRIRRGTIFHIRRINRRFVQRLQKRSLRGTRHPMFTTRPRRPNVTRTRQKQNSGILNKGPQQNGPLPIGKRQFPIQIRGTIRSFRPFLNIRSPHKNPRTLRVTRGINFSPTRSNTNRFRTIYLSNVNRGFPLRRTIIPIRGLILRGTKVLTTSIIGIIPLHPSFGTLNMLLKISLTISGKGLRVGKNIRVIMRITRIFGSNNLNIHLHRLMTSIHGLGTLKGNTKHCPTRTILVRNLVKGANLHQVKLTITLVLSSSNLGLFLFNTNRLSQHFYTHFILLLFKR